MAHFTGIYRTYIIQLTKTVFIGFVFLTYRGRATHIYVGNLTIIGSDDGLLPGRRQAIIWTNAQILLIGPLGKTAMKY